MSPLVTKCWAEYSMPSVTPSMVWDQSRALRETELKSKPPVSFLDNLSTSPCRPVLKPSTVWCPSAEDRENLSSVIDKPEKPPLQSIQF